MNMQVPLDINSLPVGDNQTLSREEQYNKQSGNINLDLNEYVRNKLLSRGITIARSSPYYIKQQQEQERKKTLLENIQNQMNLSKNSKLKELQRKRIEDQKYLKDMINSFPFGRGGGGAPIRDKNGNIVATRRALISDPKYNLISINVDDDFHDVWDKDKRYGLVNFKNRPMNIENFKNEYSNFLNDKYGHNNNLNMSMNEYNNPSEMRHTLNRNMSAQQIIPNYMQSIQMNQPMMYNNNMNVSQRFPSNRNEVPPFRFSNNYYNNSNEYNNSFSERQYNNYSQRSNNMRYSDYPQRRYNDGQEQVNVPNIDNAEVNISYDNYELNEETRKRNQESYKDDLLAQIKEKHYRQLMERQKRAQEEKEEEERLKRENEELQRKLMQEKANQSELDIIKTNKGEINSKTEVVNDNSKEADYNKKQQENETRVQLNDEIAKLKDQMQQQQMSLFNQINLLRKETEDANKQRFEALREIEKLKDELIKQRTEEDLRRKYVYDVIGGEPKGDEDNLLEGSSTLKRPPVILPVPNPDEMKEGKIKSDSSYIDLDTHNLVGLERYSHQPTESERVETTSSNNGYQIKGEYGTLGTNKQFEKCIENDIKEIEKGEVDVNRIYNKNLQRIRFLNNMEDKFNCIFKMDKTRRPSRQKVDSFIEKMNNLKL